jgi:hypothetical protein
MNLKKATDNKKLSALSCMPHAEQPNTDDQIQTKTGRILNVE